MLAPSVLAKSAAALESFAAVLTGIQSVAELLLTLQLEAFCGCQPPAEQQVTLGLTDVEFQHGQIPDVVSG